LNSDSAILDLIRNKRDEGALMMLYRANRRAVTSYVVRNSGTNEEAEDMLQEAVIVLWEKIRSGNFEYRSKLSTFILATVKNLWLRRLARRRKELPQGESFETAQDDSPSPLEALIEEERVTLIRDALKKLGEPCRQLLLLFYWEELTLEEISARMGFANADTVKSKKYQCKKALEGLIPNTK